jgi:hypothetical protein
MTKSRSAVGQKRKLPLTRKSVKQKDFLQKKMLKNKLLLIKRKILACLRIPEMEKHIGL